MYGKTFIVTLTVMYGKTFTLSKKVDLERVKNNPIRIRRRKNKDYSYLQETLTLRVNQ